VDRRGEDVEWGPLWQPHSGNGEGSPASPSHSPSPVPPTQGPPSYSPIPPSAPLPPQQGWPAPQSWPSHHHTQDGQGWVANTVQMVRRWSGRVAAVPPVDQHPLVLYRPVTPLLPPKSKRWKRSRSVRVAMMMKHRRERWKQARPNAKAIWTSVLVSILLLLVIIFSSSSAYGYSYYQSQLPQLQGLANQQISQTTRIYDRNGVLLYEAYDNSHLGGGRRTPVTYNYLPQVLKDAMTSAEDPTFWTNSGIDPVGVLRAGIQYIQAHGTVQSGGSSITQQLIKNLTHNDAVSLNRKIPEAALAIGLTQQYTKGKILEMYFNVSSYGAQNLGVEAAVEDYFHLTPQCDSNFNCIPGVYYLNCDAAHEMQCNPEQCATSKEDYAKYCDPMLGLARASLLAGMPQNPPAYDPTLGIVDQATGQKYYLERQQYVLGQMLRLGIQVPGLGPITQAMVDQVQALTARMQFPMYAHSYYHGSQHFVQWVISQMVAQLGDTFFTGGFNIRTTIDYRLEAYVESAVRRHLQKTELQIFPTYRYGVLSSPTYNLYDAAVVAMDAKTGEVLAMDGSADYNSTNKEIQGKYNVAVDPLRSPGSSIKPIVYATAFQQGWYPGIVVPDYKTYFPASGSGSPAICDFVHAYCPQDYGGGYTNSTTSVRQALANSRNVPAVKASLYAGVNNAINMAQRFGITTLNQKQDNNLSFALGTSGISLLQMVGAYQVFADNGVRVPPKSILDIWDNYGHHLYHYDPTHPGGVQVISPQIAFLMTSVLSDEEARRNEFWPDHDLSFWGNVGMADLPNPGYPNVAAKTGTTEDFRDNWTVGYTSGVVVGVWGGNADNSPMTNQVVGITGAAPIWHSVITYLSGMCNQANDGIPCPNTNLYFKPQTFTPPPGVVKQCVSASNGLASSGSGNCDYMLSGEYPGSTGVTNTNNPTPTPTP
jgi:membrane peptidoglycan carboxypeptidase